MMIFVNVPAAEPVSDFIFNIPRLACKKLGEEQKKHENNMLYFLAILAFIFGNDKPAPAPNLQPWLILYSSRATLEELKPFNPIVFNPSNAPALDSLSQTKTIYAHINFGKLLSESSEISFMNYEQNVDPGMFVSRWIDDTAEYEIKPLTDKGFNGLYIDNMAEFTQILTKASYNVGDVLVQIFSALQLRFPGLSIMMEEDPEAVGFVGDMLAGVMKQGVITKYDDTNGGYIFLDDQARDAAVSQLQQVKEQFPNITIYTVDFWDPSDKATIKKIYDIQLANGFHPYVGDLGLNKIVAK